ncbi:DUF317 domain-containing protein [Streptomyces rubiginosohelvolus]|uniref:DUF317 domain-containing protein n=1 Tax=Streptomyces rubiginosohelvolus TaxID=67362 RepID=UPI0035D6C8AF
MALSPQTVAVDFITPRHLAGGGDPAWITAPLHQACGWTYDDDPLMPRVVLTSPDKSAVLRLEPNTDGQWWVLHHHGGTGLPDWYASFGARTPVELIAGFVDALTDPAPPAAASDPFEPLRQHSWESAQGTPGLASSDGTAFVQRLGDERGPGPWFITATLGYDRPVWQARFGENTPSHLVTAFTTALSDPQPVWRTNSPLGLPTLDPKVISRHTVTAPKALVPAALADRVTTLADRPHAPKVVPNPPEPPAPGASRRR